jgi:hypothetical protein
MSAKSGRQRPCCLAGQPLLKHGLPHTFTVIAEGHLRLAETNGVLSSGHAIELLKLGLLNALEVD